MSDVACFLVIASTPQGDWRSKFGFTTTAWPGVYQGTGAFAERVRILLLNELTPAPHNAPLKCFATKRRERDAAFAAISSSGFDHLSERIEQLTLGLRRIFMPHASQIDEFTPNRVMEMGRELIDAVIKAAPIEEFLSHYKPNEVLNHYQPEQLLAGLTDEQRLAGLTEEQIRAYLERLNH